MKLTCLRTGLHLTLNAVPYRIDRMLVSGECYLERVSDLAIFTKKREEIMSLYAQGLVTFDGEKVNANSNAKRNARDISSLSDNEQRIVLRKYEYIKAACAVLGNIPTKNNLSDVIQKVTVRLDDKDPPKDCTVYRWWKSWIAAGNDLMVLNNKIPGKRGSRRFKGTVHDEIEAVIDEVYLTKQKRTKQYAFDVLQRRIEQLNKARLVPLRIPSRSTFFRMLEKINRYEEMSAREGKRTAEKHFRAAGKGVAPKHILERVEVDHTQLDIILVHEITGYSIGRPTLTVLLDRFSRMVLGIAVGFEPPSELSVMRALKNAILPKEYVKNDYPDIENDWPAYGVPMSLVCDNGLEFHAINLRKICSDLNIDLQFCPKLQPHYKGAVERFIGTLNRQVCHQLPGTTFSNIASRGEYDAVKNACLTLGQLKALIHDWIINIYCQTVHGSTNRTPVSMWIEDREFIEPILPESSSALNFLMTKQVNRTLTHKGVQLQGLFFNSQELSLMRMALADEADCLVRYDPENLGSVWVYDSNNMDYLRVPCINEDYAEGLSERTHFEIRKDCMAKGKEEENTLNLMESKARYREKISDLSKNKLLKERKKAARSQGNMACSDSLLTGNFSRQPPPDFDDEWSMDDIPVFEVSQKGGM